MKDTMLVPTITDEDLAGLFDGADDDDGEVHAICDQCHPPEWRDGRPYARPGTVTLCGRRIPTGAVGRGDYPLGAVTCPACRREALRHAERCRR